MGREVQSERTRIIDWNIHSVVCEGFVCFVGCFGFLRVWGFFNLSNSDKRVFYHSEDTWGEKQVLLSVAFTASVVA